ncbi:hypothetical protein [Domibacillus antri]|nr:hypothetical protein [Domibacillus antri]
MISFIINILYAIMVISCTIIVFEFGRAWEYANPTVKRKDLDAE